MLFKARNKILFIFILILTFGNQLSFGKFLFPPKDSLYRNHTLNGHRFIVNSQIGSPFIETYLQNRIGAGQTINLNIPELFIDSVKVTELKGELIYTTIDLEYQQAIRDWMAFRARVILSGKLGTEAGSLISEGVNFATGYELGWLFELYRNKEFILSGSLDVVNRSFTVVNLKDFVQGVVDSGKIVKSNNLVRTSPTLKAGGSLKFAYAFNQTFGFAGNVNLLYGESVDRTADSKSYFEYGGVFDADLMPKQNIPIGFLAGFYHNALPLSTEQLESDPNNILFGINYTGKKDLNLGMEINYQFYKPTGFEESIKFVTMALNFRYFF